MVGLGAVEKGIADPPPVLPEMIVFVTVKVPVLLMPPPLPPPTPGLASLAVLLVIVSALSVSVPLFRIPPPKQLGVSPV